MRRWVWVVVCVSVLGVLFAASGCNTWRGMGKDVEKAGEGMQGP